jgi:hypothetical protein
VLAAPIATHFLYTSQMKKFVLTVLPLPSIEAKENTSADFCQPFPGMHMTLIDAAL